MTGILVAVDATPAAEPVLRTAAVLGQALGWAVQALHVGAEPGPRDVADELGLPLTVVDGDPEREVLATAENSRADLVVVGMDPAPGPEQPGHMVDVLHHALNAPLLVVPPSAPVRPAIRRVLFALDGSPSVAAAARPAMSMFSAAGLAVAALHVFEPRTVPLFHDGAEDDAVWREEFLDQNCAGLEVTLTTSAGPFIPALLEAAAQADADLIALPARPGTSLRGATVIRDVLVASDRPVVLVTASPHPVTGATAYSDPPA